MIDSSGRGIPKGGTNYSGVLECPCNEGYGGDPEYYGNNTKTKQAHHQFSAIDSGVCPNGQDMSGAQQCFYSAAQLGINATHFVNKTVSDPKVQSGCAVVVNDATATATVTWNTGKGAACAASSVKVGETTSAVGVTLALQYDTQGGKSAMKRGSANNWCKNNKDHTNQLNQKQPFEAASLSKRDLGAALAACEAYCTTNAACNFCSVDDLDNENKTVTGVQWWALKTCVVVTEGRKGLPHGIPGDVSASQLHIVNQNGATSGFETCFATGSQHLWRRGSQPKHVSYPA